MSLTKQELVEMRDKFQKEKNWVENEINDSKVRINQTNFTCTSASYQIVFQYRQQLKQYLKLLNMNLSDLNETISTMDEKRLSMNNFELNEKAMELADSNTAYGLARKLVELENEILSIYFAPPLDMAPSDPESNQVVCNQLKQVVLRIQKERN